MTTIISHSDLVRRAAAFIIDELKEAPSRSVDALVEEASVRFNLGPLDSEALLNLFRNGTPEDC